MNMARLPLVRSIAAPGALLVLEVSGRGLAARVRRFAGIAI